VISVLSAIGLAVVVFATTNVDDILLLSAFFADPAFRAPRWWSASSSASAS
jgi:cadmium resistance protein CadD (predicted permease)